jgi:isopentenyldiphosphate isomerase
MDAQIILAVNDKGEFSGEYVPKEQGHTGEGKRHLAISVLLFDLKGEVLPQERKHWSNAPSS